MRPNDAAAQQRYVTRFAPSRQRTAPRPETAARGERNARDARCDARRAPLPVRAACDDTLARTPKRATRRNAPTVAGRARPGIEMRRRSAAPESISKHRRRTRPDHAMTLEQASPRRHPTRESPNDGAT
ncbi:hypothetical protein DO72_5865 [Burkholderia pseudomallei]|nr:hypothetical protein DO72_5873 [Burkholderia pseudomallei]KGD34598.1 hypothetical protein DO72_5865 [Burkholderia pseudomallei]